VAPVLVAFGCVASAVDVFDPVSADVLDAVDPLVVPDPSAQAAPLLQPVTMAATTPAVTAKPTNARAGMRYVYRLAACCTTIFAGDGKADVRFARLVATTVFAQVTGLP
jgi:hypothetical protein